MSLTREEVLHTAHLSKLTLTEDEVTEYTRELSAVIDHFEGLSEVNTDNVPPTSQTTGLVNVLRADEVRETSRLPMEKALSEAPKSHNGFFVVPLVLTKDAS